MLEESLWPIPLFEFLMKKQNKTKPIISYPFQFKFVIFGRGNTLNGFSHLYPSVKEYKISFLKKNVRELKSNGIQGEGYCGDR